ncbi:MAG: DNA adenine methylase [Bradymonadaceae bacterium]
MFDLRAPFPYPGGKSSVADVVWAQLGDVDHYIEPFAGGLGVLLGRPQNHVASIETVNDADGYIVNAWRAIQQAPSQTARRILSRPVSELDLHAWNKQLKQCREDGSLEAMAEKLRDDPMYFDVEIAAVWIWGVCAWPGGGWTSKDHERRPVLARPGRGVHALKNRDSLQHVFRYLSERLQHVRICCGDWTRVVTGGENGALACGSDVGVFLDPPYSHNERDARLYAHEMPDSTAVRNWAVENASDRVRVVLCGMEGEHEMPDDWNSYKWTTNGFGSREVIHFSPTCAGGTEQQQFF